MRVGEGTAALHDGRLTTESLEKTGTGAQPKESGGRAERAPDEPSPFERMLRGLGREVDRGEGLVQRALGGAGRAEEVSHLELLSLQAGVYRYVEAVDLSAKLVDRASNGVKTVLQGQ